MSFGFAVGDIIDALQLFERLATEVRNYRDAPQHFQQLGTELHLLQRTLQRLLQVEPNDEDEKDQVEQIRAIALHCHQPVQAFIDKMRPSDISLGHVSSLRTLSTIGRRLHWSLITRGDVDELRKVIMSEMVAINMLLAIQQLSTLRKLKTYTNLSFGSETSQSCARPHEFSGNLEDIFDRLKKMPGYLNKLQVESKVQTTKQHELKCHIDEKLAPIKSDSSDLVCQGNTIAIKMRNIEAAMTRSITTVLSITEDVKTILSMIQRFSRILYEKLASNGQKLLEIHRMMKRLIRSVEAIPLHLTLPIVRLDDALGESWALPYQACQTFWDFGQILTTVVFPNGRPGAMRVELGQYVIRLIKDGTPLGNQTWKNLVKGGAHLTQALVLPNATATRRKCFFPECAWGLGNFDMPCPVCGSQFTFRSTTMPPWELEYLSQPASAASTTERRDRGPQILDLLVPREVQLIDDDIEVFHNLHLVEGKDAIKSMKEARNILQHESSHAKALQYVGWRYLCAQKDLALAIKILDLSVQSDPSLVESWYLLGRAYMALDEEIYGTGVHYNRKDASRLDTDCLGRVFRDYQQALNCNHRCSTLWLSVGLLLYRVDRWDDCFHAFTTSIRLNSCVPVAWRNLGYLYEHFTQIQDAADAYEKAFDLGLTECQDRLHALREHIHHGTPIPDLDSRMYDYDLRPATNETHGFDEHGLMKMAGLHLDDASDDEWVDTSDDESDESKDSSDDKSQYESASESVTGSVECCGRDSGLEVRGNLLGDCYQAFAWTHKI